MRPTRRRGIPLLMALAMLLTLAAAPVHAITLQRTWSAKVGSSGANGRITLRAYTNGVGSISYSLKGLRANATYSVQIRNGTCASLGSVAARPPSVHTSATGTVTRTDNLLPWLITKVWPTARHKTFIVRIVSGTSIRCGGFTFARATRVAVPGIGIDLPVIRGTSGYPLCRVAMYLPSVAQPREPGITFIYAHARTGMFLPLLTRWRINNGASLIGRTVKVWTSDSYVSYYRITRVRKSSNSTLGVFSLTRERLWLQTSTGPNYTYAKLIVEAARYKTVKTTYSASHPKARPVRC
jgi:sortase (surface protein transpeptidase)